MTLGSDGITRSSREGSGPATTSTNPNRQSIVSYTDTQLVAMKSDLESDRLERKRSASDTNRIRRSICALANDFPAHGEPGVILIGVEDDGRCSGLQIGDGLLKLLAGFRDDGTIIPLPSITVEKRILDGCEVAVILVYPSRDTPLRFPRANLCPSRTFDPSGNCRGGTSLGGAPTGP